MVGRLMAAILRLGAARQNNGRDADRRRSEGRPRRAADAQLLAQNLFPCPSTSFQPPTAHNTSLESFNTLYSTTNTCDMLKISKQYESLSLNYFFFIIIRK